MIRSVITSRRVLLRTVAVWLLLLAASPLTAPFCTFDFESPSSSAPAFDAGKTKAADNPLLAGPLRFIARLPPDSDLGVAFRSRPAHRVHAAAHAVLRR